ncbi:hypothetical protein HMPREF1326_00774 [Akkermansia sp. KLE1605]|nr:hypothetical protein HMPREF1326_00774 [Akkermansia sp. KLE1605]
MLKSCSAGEVSSGLPGTPKVLEKGLLRFLPATRQMEATGSPHKLI